VRLLGDAHLNADAIHLIDLCPLVDTSRVPCPPGGGGGPTPCGVTQVTLRLDGGAAGTVYKNSSELASPTCPPLTLGPQGTTDVYLSITSSQSCVYPLATVLDLERGGTAQTLTLMRQAATLNFAAVAQRLCYQLQGASLVPLSPSSGGEFCY
jgi:hypothetical protein